VLEPKHPTAVLSLFKGDAETTGKVGARWKADVWAHTKLGGVKFFHEFIHVLLISSPEAIRVAAWRGKGDSTSDAVVGGSRGLGWNCNRGGNYCMRLGITVYM